MKLFSLLVFTFIQLSTSLTDLFDSIYYPQQHLVRLDAQRLQSNSLGTFLQGFSGSANSELTDANCDILFQHNSSFINCEGQLRLSNATSISAKLVLLQLSPNKREYGIHFQTTLTLDQVHLLKHWVDFPLNPWVLSRSNYLHNSFQLAISAGSNRFSYGSSKKKVHVFPHFSISLVASLSPDSSLFHLDNFFSISGAILGLNCTLGYQNTDTYAVNWEMSSLGATLGVNSISFSDYGRIKSPEFRFDLIDLVDPYPQITLSGLFIWQPAAVSTGLEFQIFSRWNPRLSKIEIQGELLKTYTFLKPLGWLELERAMLHLNIYSSSESKIKQSQKKKNKKKENDLVISARSRIQLEHESFAQELIVIGFNRFKHYLIQCTFESKFDVRTQLLRTLNFTPDPQFFQLRLEQYKFQLTFTSYRYRLRLPHHKRTLKYSRGFSLLNSISLQHQTDSMQSRLANTINQQLSKFTTNRKWIEQHEISAAIEITIGMDRHFDLIDPSDCGIHLQLGIEKFQLTPAVTLMDMQISLNFQDFEDNEGDIEFESTLQWKPHNIQQHKDEDMEIDFQVSAQYNIEDKEIELEGGFQDEWKAPAQLEWLTIDHATINLIWTCEPFQVQSFSIVGKGSIKLFSAAEIIVATDFIGLNEAKDYILTGTIVYHDIDPVQVLSSIASDPSLYYGHLKDLRFKSTRFEFQVVTRAITHRSQKYFPGARFSTSVAFVDNGEIGKKLKDFYQRPHQDVELSVIFQMFIPFQSNPKPATISLRTPKVLWSDNVVFEGGRFQIALSEDLVISLSGAVAVKFQSQPAPIRFSVQGNLVNVQAIELAGAMDGTWHQVMGLPGVDLDMMWAKIGVQLSPPFFILLASEQKRI